MDDYVINNPKEFFNYCKECQNEVVHFCSEDSTIYKDNNHNPLFGISGILVSREDTLESLNMITPIMSAGPDGIPGILLR